VGTPVDVVVGEGVNGVAVLLGAGVLLGGSVPVAVGVWVGVGACRK
jgi:hypothetical protein